MLYSSALLVLQLSYSTGITTSIHILLSLPLINLFCISFVISHSTSMLYVIDKTIHSKTCDILCFQCLSESYTSTSTVVVNYISYFGKFSKEQPHCSTKYIIKMGIPTSDNNMETTTTTPTYQHFILRTYFCFLPYFYSYRKKTQINYS